MASTVLLRRSLRLSHQQLSKALSSATENNWKIVHKPDINEFAIDLPPKLPEHPKSSKAVLQYDWLDGNTVDLHHTGVPDHYTRRGIAKVLATAAFDHFLANDVKMDITCTYLVKFVKDTNYRSLADTYFP